MKKLSRTFVILLCIIVGLSAFALEEYSRTGYLTAKIEKQERKIVDLEHYASKHRAEIANLSKALSETPNALQRLLRLKHLKNMNWEQSRSGQWMCYLTLYSDGLSWKDITYSETGESPELAAIGVLKMIDEYRKKMCESLEEKP